MPELPEVETIVRQLNHLIKGKTIVDLEIKEKGFIDKKINSLLPLKVLNVKRRAKLIILELSNNYYLVVHLRMTGHFKKETTKNIMFVIKFSDNTSLYHCSIRKFGNARLYSQSELEKELSKYGPEPLEINFNQFYEIMLKKKRANIKTTLMDPSVIVGVGNIYATESLFCAKISPLLKVEQISKERLKLLFKCLIKILKQAIKQNGSTVDNYSHLEAEGSYQNELKVYGQKKCSCCGKKLSKINIGGRGTYYCDVCQV
jgi:formamidopyrimidine-DNA glycosylase